MTGSDAAPTRVSGVGWQAIASAALDVRGSDAFEGGAEIVLVPAVPSDPLSLVGDGAALWRRLVAHGPLFADEVDATEAAILRDMEDLGIAAYGVEHPARVRAVACPLLSSPLHELVYAVVASVARDLGIRCVFIKGPVLYLQGLREREHSGDVDVWCEPARWDDLAAALTPWGWERVADPWEGTGVNHSATLVPRVWGCEIDVHRRMPGLALEDDEAFDVLWRHTEGAAFGAKDLRTPSAPMHAVVSALHNIRPELGCPDRGPEASDAARDLLQRAPGAVDCAKAIGAVPALRAELASIVGADALRGHDDGVPRDWAWRGEPDRIRAYWAALRGLSLSTRVRLVWRLLWPTAAVARESARRAGDGATSVTGARLRRIGRAARAWVGTTVRRHG